MQEDGTISACWQLEVGRWRLSFGILEQLLDLLNRASSHAEQRQGARACGGEEIVRRVQGSRLMLTTVLAGAVALGSACQGRQTEPAATDATTPVAGQTDASAERQMITLTGCLQRGPAGEFTLASVATGGVLEPGETPERENTAPAASTPESRAQLSASSSYRLLPAEDQDFSEYANARVAVRGRLAPDVPTGTAGTRPQDGSAGDTSAGKADTGTEVESGAATSTVAGSAPPLRGFHVESLRKVSDSCSN